MTGTSIQFWFVSYRDFRSEATLGIALGASSASLASVWIMVHYNFIEMVKEGGWLELGSSFVAVLLWIVGCSVLTQEGSIAATLVGEGCRHNGVMAFTVAEKNCTVTFLNEKDVYETMPCNDVTQRFIPGSNLYASLWLCLGVSLNVAFKWKQQQAQNFAHAQQSRTTPAPRKQTELPETNQSFPDVNDDDLDDLDDFQDVDVF